MTTEKLELKVKVKSERPDFRVFACYFFGNDFHSYDSDGNSFPVTSRNWTELYMGSREIADLSFEIWPIYLIFFLSVMSLFDEISKILEDVRPKCLRDPSCSRA